jgi:hypothetical protein
VRVALATSCRLDKVRTHSTASSVDRVRVAAAGAGSTSETRLDGMKAVLLFTWLCASLALIGGAAASNASGASTAGDLSVRAQWPSLRLPISAQDICIHTVTVFNDLFQGAARQSRRLLSADDGDYYYYPPGTQPGPNGKRERCPPGALPLCTPSTSFERAAFCLRRHPRGVFWRTHGACQLAASRTFGLTCDCLKQVLPRLGSESSPASLAPA